MQKMFGVLSGVFLIIGFIPYIKYIIVNRHSAFLGKPKKASWLIWASNDSIILIGMIVASSWNIQIASAVLCAVTVTILAFLYGERGWKKIDIVCGVAAVAGVALSFYFNDETIAIVASNIVLIIGAIPTFISTVEDPSRENRAAWGWWSLSCVCALLAVPKWDLANYAQPVTFTIIDVSELILLWTLLLFRRKVQA